jgi:hypothetical protein
MPPIKLSGLQFGIPVATSFELLRQHLKSSHSLDVQLDRGISHFQDGITTVIIPATRSDVRIEGVVGAISASKHADGSDGDIIAAIVDLDVRAAAQSLTFVHVVNGAVVSGPKLPQSTVASFRQGSTGANHASSVALSALASLSGDVFAAAKYQPVGLTPEDIVRTNLSFVTGAAHGAIGLTVGGVHVMDGVSCCCCTSWGSCSCTCASPADRLQAHLIADDVCVDYLACLDSSAHVVADWLLVGGSSGRECI